MIKQPQRFLFAVLLALGAGSLQPVAAQTASPVTPLMLQQWRLGQDLAGYGLAQNDPVALFAAAMSTTL